MWLTADEVRIGMQTDFKSAISGEHYEVKIIFKGIADLLKNSPKKRVLELITRDDDFTKSKLNYIYEHQDKYVDRTILLMMTPSDSDERNYFIAVYGYDKRINTNVGNHIKYDFRLPATERWKASHKLANTNTKVGMFEHLKSYHYFTLGKNTSK